MEDENFEARRRTPLKLRIKYRRRRPRQTIIIILLTIFFTSSHHIKKIVNGFSFTLKSVGSKQVTVTPGDQIVYNAHFSVSDSTPLSVHASLPYHQTPIFSIERMEVLGIGYNLETSTPSFSYSKKASGNNNLRSRGTVDFGNVSRVTTASGNDEVVVQIKTRLLQHSNVTDGAVFWLYFGMDYKDDSVWVIGKSITANVEKGSAKLIGKIWTSQSDQLSVKLRIRHAASSTKLAKSVEVVVSHPSFLTYNSFSIQNAWPSVTITPSGNTVKVEWSSNIKVGVSSVVTLKMTISASSPSDKGRFLNGIVFGDLKYQTVDEQDCQKTIERKYSMKAAVSYYSPKDTCDAAISTIVPATDLKASSAILPCCGPQNATAPPDSSAHWEPWGNSTYGLVDDFLQVNFGKKATVTRLLTAGHEKKFVRSFYVSYSQDSVFWKYIRHFGKPKEFEANVDGTNTVLTVFKPEITARYIRIHPKKRSASGSALHIMPYGCVDSADSQTYVVYQRGFLATAVMLIVCSVRPDRRILKSNCYASADGGLRWEGLDPRVVNVIGFDPGAYKIYGLGLTTGDNDYYMELETPMKVRIITKASWTTLKDAGGLTLPTVIPLTPVNGNRMDEIAGTSVTVGSVTYVATPEGLLKQESGNSRMIISWAEYRRQ